MYRTYSPSWYAVASVRMVQFVLCRVSFAKCCPMGMSSSGSGTKEPGKASTQRPVRYQPDGTARSRGDPAQQSTSSIQSSLPSSCTLLRWATYRGPSAPQAVYFLPSSSRKSM